MDKPQDFEAVKARLEEIADAVGDENMPLDEAFDLFEEAVALGLQVGETVEEGIVVARENEGVAADGSASGDADKAAGQPHDPSSAR